MLEVQILKCTRLSLNRPVIERSEVFLAVFGHLTEPAQRMKLLLLLNNTVRETALTNNICYHENEKKNKQT